MSFPRPPIPATRGLDEQKRQDTPFEVQKKKFALKSIRNHTHFPTEKLADAAARLATGVLEAYRYGATIEEITKTLPELNKKFIDHALLHAQMAVLHKALELQVSVSKNRNNNMFKPSYDQLFSLLEACEKISEKNDNRNEYSEDIKKIAVVKDIIPTAIFVQYNTWKKEQAKIKADNLDILGINTFTKK